MSVFFLACGGTGGHLAPGIALAEELLRQGHSCLLLVSRKRVDARLLEKYPEQEAIALPGRAFSWHPWHLLQFLSGQVAAFLRVISLCRSRRPDLVFAFGGFTSVAVVLAAALRRIPIVLHEANRVPGRSVRILAPLARFVLVPPGVRLPGLGPDRLLPCAFPVRHDTVRLQRQKARRQLGLNPNQKVLVVLGGSQGSTALSQWAMRHLVRLAEAGVQVYCLCGLSAPATGTGTLGSRNGSEVRSCFTGFSDNMASVLSAADLVVSRAGAGTIAELCRCRAPSILVPYPYAADNHQMANARYHELRGGGLVLSEAFLDNLIAEVLDLIFNDWLLQRMRENLAGLDAPDTAGKITGLLERITHNPDLRPGPASREIAYP